MKEKTSGLKKINDTCPPKGERTLKNIFCKEIELIICKYFEFFGINIFKIGLSNILLYRRNN